MPLCLRRVEGDHLQDMFPLLRGPGSFQTTGQVEVVPAYDAIPDEPIAALGVLETEGFPTATARVKLFARSALLSYFSIPTDRPSPYPGLVQSHDDMPKRRLCEDLKDQGWQENQPVTFMTDGGDTVFNMALHMAPASEHILDRFPITMRITVMQQHVKGLAHHAAEGAEKLSRLCRMKGFLWNGNLHEGMVAIEDLVIDLDEIETDYPRVRALRKADAEFETYIANNQDMIPTMRNGSATASACQPVSLRAPSTPW